MLLCTFALLGMILDALYYCRTSLFIERLGRSQPHNQGKTKRQQLQAHHGLWGAPRSDRDLCWNRVFAHYLLYSHGITWMIIGEVKIQPLKGKYWVTRLKILQNISNNYNQA